MGVLSWLILGLIVGIIAKLLLPGKDPGGVIMTIILGITGSVWIPIRILICGIFA